MQPTPYESDIAGEPEALRRLASSSLPSELAGIELDRFDRIVLSGMGSSHDAAHAIWRRLIAAGKPAWWCSTPHLLDVPELVGDRTLLVLTSQSGRSGEVVRLLDELPQGAGRRLVAVTNDPSSPLGERADVVVELHSGDEATVSTKSYANTLAAHALLGDALLGAGDAAAQQRRSSILAAAQAVESLEPDLGELAKQALADRLPRIVLVGSGARTTSALFGALILKEAAKLAAEGFVGGEFRHGPLELAGPGLLAVVFRNGEREPSLSRLAADLVTAGSRVLNVGSETGGGGDWVRTPAADELGDAICDAKVVQRLSVELARANGVEPGSFRFGAKITTIL